MPEAKPSGFLLQNLNHLLMLLVMPAITEQTKPDFEHALIHKLYAAIGLSGEDLTRASQQATREFLEDAAGFATDTTDFTQEQADEVSVEITRCQTNDEALKFLSDRLTPEQLAYGILEATKATLQGWLEKTQELSEEQRLNVNQVLLSVVPKQ